MNNIIFILFIFVGLIMATNSTETSILYHGHISGSFIMLIVMLVMAGLLAICGVIFGIYVCCQKNKKIEYVTIV